VGKEKYDSRFVLTGKVTKVWEKFAGGEQNQERRGVAAAALFRKPEGEAHIEGWTTTTIRRKKGGGDVWNEWGWKT